MSLAANQNIPDQVYLMRAGEYYKIGVSNNPKKRVRQMQTGCPEKIEVLRCVEHDDAYKLESELHGLYQDKRTHGEWFAGINEFEFVRAVKIYEQFLEWVEENPEDTFPEFFNEIDDPYLDLYFEIRFNGEITKGGAVLEDDVLVKTINIAIKHMLGKDK